MLSKWAQHLLLDLTPPGELHVKQRTLLASKALQHGVTL
jgi:hypothetical protein